MDYEDIIKYDKRTYLRMYWACLVYSQINSGTFSQKITCIYLLLN